MITEVGIYSLDAHRWIFVVSSVIAIYLLIKRMKSNNKKGYGYFAITYFVVLFLFYLSRFFNVPSSIIIVNALSNMIHLFGSIVIFFTAYGLLEDG